MVRIHSHPTVIWPDVLDLSLATSGRCRKQLSILSSPLRGPANLEQEQGVIDGVHYPNASKAQFCPAAFHGHRWPRTVILSSRAYDKSARHACAPSCSGTGHTGFCAPQTQGQSFAMTDRPLSVELSCLNWRFHARLTWPRFFIGEEGLFSGCQRHCPGR